MHMPSKMHCTNHDFPGLNKVTDRRDSGRWDLPLGFIYCTPLHYNLLVIERIRFIIPFYERDKLVGLGTPRDVKITKPTRGNIMNPAMNSNLRTCGPSLNNGFSRCKVLNLEPDVLFFNTRGV